MSEAHFSQPISEQIWNQKYRFKTEREGFEADHDVVDTWGRIATACSNLPHLHNNHAERDALTQRFFKSLYDFKFLPAGRINSGAGTGRNVTLFNCYVMGTIPDSLDGIFDMLKEAALTMQQGGGIGYDFSTLRPKGALVKGVESFSSGPLTFMDVWDSMCKTIMSAGSRRGAMMATMRCDHPDIMEFVTAKQDPLRLRNFNVSVLCTDEFMEAVANNEPWDLVFDGKVYETIPDAAMIWEAILQNTYDYAEPGVIFIDRINKENNLWFLETIAATNPCGEQPLPPYGACLLGSVNLAKHVVFPFTEQADVDMKTLEESVRTGVRLLDSVVETSLFPLEAQKDEARFKRRQGLGVTGLADLLFMTGYRYGSPESLKVTEEIMMNIAIWAYEESIQMAREMGPAPCLQSLEAREKFIQSGFMQRMPQFIKDDILEVGIRNSHLLSVAPTGTISMYAGNVSSGGEPIFAPSFWRKVTNDDGTKREEKVYDYAVLKFEEHFGDSSEGKAWWDNYMATAQDLTPADHINMQAVLQKWVDSSISKTVNLPREITFEEFKAVYDHAYATGCKGCTTYRPNDVTGSVLSVETKEEKPDMVKFTVTEEDGERHYQPEPEIVDEEYDGDMRVVARPHEVTGSTYKCRWNGDSYYVTFNNVVDPDHDWFMPFEIFINSKNVEHHQWTAALTRMVSAVFQRGGDVRFVAEELKQIHDPKGGQWVDGHYCPSLVALIGQKLSEHLDNIGYQSTPECAPPDYQEEVTQPEQSPDQTVPDQCPSCKGYNLIVQSGCPTCQDCGYSKCG
ncbi:ribonucleotide reductase [Dinoroseobacter phage vB_DshP-R7L]|uniref:Vitamin B12-dependent ribonucleotide reductase n=1 Tax=Dinoroseobacter phage vB_DshP-R7L TaxID=2873349 RepID=A0AAE8XEG7_9CAUD|nr:ribonucleotide reductase [Dinoroseobacter phage vB_DshP-R7L]UAT28894.1 ribonucleotide reductase large subunit [Dinoroseobacter phage vB_DshP-R7L]